MSRKMKTILTVSVILNVLLLGLSGGMLYKKWQWKSGRAHLAGADFAPDTRNVIARNFQAARNDMKDEFNKSRQIHKDLIDLLRAETIDEEAYAQKVKALDDIQGDLMVRRMEMLKDIALDLSPEERKKISKSFMKPYGPQGHHGDKQSKPKDD
jgi:uncharacterized membrane protein